MSKIDVEVDPDFAGDKYGWALTRLAQEFGKENLRQSSTDYGCTRAVAVFPDGKFEAANALYLLRAERLDRGQTGFNLNRAPQQLEAFIKRTRDRAACPC